MAIAIWVGYPKSYTPGRARPVQYAVVHYTAGSEGPTSAEDGAAYDKKRTDGTSTHCFADSNTVVREVPDGDRAHAARFHGNEIGLQLEICGTAQTRDQWLDVTSSATLRLAAKQVAEWCYEHDLPVRRLSVAETRAAYYNAAGQRPKGIVGHVDITEAYPEDDGSHTDPGPDFPWDVFLKWTSEELAILAGEEYTMRPMLVRFADAADPGQIWYCDGQFRRRVLPVWWANGTGPITNVQVHQEGLLGNLQTGTKGNGQPGQWDSTGTVFVSAGDQNVFGVDVATLQGGGGGAPPAGPVDLTPASVTTVANTTADILHNRLAG